MSEVRSNRAWRLECEALLAERDEAVALLREAPLGQHDRGWWNRIDAFLAKVKP